MRPLKTGAARIALGAAAALGGEQSIAIVPAGIYYRAKQIFRSVALLYFAEPFPVTPLAEPLAPGAEPPAGPVRELTAQIQRALAEVTLQAGRLEALALVAKAERILRARDKPPDVIPTLAEELELRRRLALGHDVLRERWPDRFAAIESRIVRYEATLEAAGVEPHHLTPHGYTITHVARYTVQAAIVFLFLLPLALAGAIVHYPAYRAVGHIATGIAKGEEETLASVKVLAAMLLFPVTWALAAAAAWVWLGLKPGLAVLVMLPLAGMGSLWFFARLDRLVGRARALKLLLFRRRAFLRLTAERRAIRDQIVELGATLGG